MKFSIKLLIINCLVFAGKGYSFDSNQKLIDQLWDNRVIKTENLNPGIVELESKIHELSDEQRAELKNLKGYIALLKGDIEKSLEITDEVIAQNLNFDLYARAKNIQVNALVFNGNIKDSFNEMYDLLDGFDNIQSDDLKLNILHSAVIRHLYAEIYDKAIELSRRNIALSKSLGLNHYYCLALIEAANIELGMKKLNQAEAELQLADIECDKHEATIFNQFIEYKLAKIAFERGDYKKAKDKLMRIYNNKNNQEYKILELEVTTLLANSMVELKQLENVYDITKDVFDYAKDNNYLYLKRDSAEVLAKYFKEKNNIEEFQKYRKIYREALLKAKAESSHRIAEYYSALQSRKNKNYQ